MCSVRPCPGEKVHFILVVQKTCQETLVESSVDKVKANVLSQLQVTGGLGSHGVLAARRVVKAYSPGSGCATTPLQLLMGCSVTGQTRRHKCARRDFVQVK